MEHKPPNPILGDPKRVAPVHVGLEKLEEALNDMAGWDRTEVASRMSSEIRVELILLSKDCDAFEKGDIYYREVVKADPDLANRLREENKDHPGALKRLGLL